MKSCKEAHNDDSLGAMLKSGAKMYCSEANMFLAELKEDVIKSYPSYA